MGAGVNGEEMVLTLINMPSLSVPKNLKNPGYPLTTICITQPTDIYARTRQWHKKVRPNDGHKEKEIIFKETLLQ